MALLSPQEVHIAENGQTLIELSYPYTKGSNDLMVFLNGLLSILDDDYIEVDEYHIQFNYQLSDQDVIVTQGRMRIDIKDLHIVGESDSLFELYGSSPSLLPNQMYTMRFAYGEQVFSHSFNTVIDPLYSSISVIQNDLGEVISDVPDQRMLFLIYQNSILSQNIASEENLSLLESETKLPYVFKQYVRYRTELDLMSAMYLYLSGRTGSVSKILGELEITKRVDLGIGFKDALNDLKMKLKKWEKLLTGSAARSPLVGAVRGGTNNPYPLTSPRMTNSDGMTGG